MDQAADVELGIFTRCCPLGSACIGLAINIRICKFHRLGAACLHLVYASSACAPFFLCWRVVLLCFLGPASAGSSSPDMAAVSFRGSLSSSSAVFSSMVLLQFSFWSLWAQFCFRLGFFLCVFIAARRAVPARVVSLGGSIGLYSYPPYKRQSWI